MIKFNLFQKHFLLAVTTLVLFIILGLGFSDYLTRTLAKSNERQRLPPVFMAKIIDRMNPSDKLKAIQELISWHNQDRQPVIILLNQKGEVLHPENYELDFDWNTIQLPLVAYGAIAIKNDGIVLGDVIRLDGAKAEFIYLPKPRIGSNGPLPKPIKEVTILTAGKGHGLRNAPTRPATPFFLMGITPSFSGPGLFPLIGLASLFGSLLLGVGVAISLIYYSIHKQVKLADQVISELQKGNLKARFPIGRKDEFGQAMMRFNTMADEIENLVEHLKRIELARTTLLQELAHDLRTPIASLKNLLETLQTKKEKLDSSTHSELTSLSLREVDYFERLVEDLLLVAQVSEHKYQRRQEPLLLNDMIETESEDNLFKYSHLGKKIELVIDNKIQDLQIVGDRHLLQRLFRNAFDNAFSFAQEKVSIRIEKLAGNLVSITIEDDGTGFSNEALKSYGERRLSRKIEHDQNGRLSVGLGSVVMKTITQAHRGQIQVSNRLEESGRILGARTQIVLPI